ncbi:Scd5 [Kluyveromyces lactis]|nr:Scd5 [Kluyveromyces lactis]
MSFDWLNVPGLDISNDSQASVSSSSPPPAVSFSFTTVDRPQEPSNRQQPQSQQSLKGREGNKLTVSGSTSNFQDSQSKSQTIDGALHSHSESDIASSYVETAQELQVPLAVPEFQLTPDERKAYLRWFRDLSSRIHSRPITLDDVFNFLANFRIDDAIKERITHIFRTCRYAVNEEQFYAIIRLVAHGLQQHFLPTRRMIPEKAPVLRPKSILSANAGQEVYEEVEEDPNNATDKKVDFDGFASLLLTGKAIQKNIRRRIMKRRDQIKKVRFSKNLVTFANDLSTKAMSSISMSGKPIVTAPDNTASAESSPSDDSTLDLSLPMEQLLAKLSSRNQNNSALVKELPSDTQPETQEEREVLEDMKDSLSHFRQIQKVDSVTQLPNNMSSYESSNSSGREQALEPLKPTATGSANYLFRQTVPPSHNADANKSDNHILEPLKPTATGSANEIFKNIFRRNNPAEHLPQQGRTAPSVPPQRKVQFTEAMKPTSTGSANYLMKQQFQDPQEFQPFQSALPPQQQQQQQYLSPRPSINAFQPPNQGQFLQPNAGGLVTSPQPQLSSHSNLSSDGYFSSLMTPSPSMMPASSPQPQNISNGVNLSAVYQQHIPEYGSNLNYQVRPNAVSPRPARSQSDNILDDLKALQQQVDQLNQTYSYDGRR